MKQAAWLILEDGSIFRGQSIGIEGHSVGELVFNTAMTGYQEILTDPSYCRQIVTLTYPHIGNTGTNSEDVESDGVYAAGLVIRDLPLLASSWRMEASLQDYLQRNDVIAIAGIDTRRLTRILRDKGAQHGCIITGDDTDIEIRAQALIAEFPGIKGMDLAKVVSTKSEYEWDETVWRYADEPNEPVDINYHVVVYDFGVKRNILRLLVAHGCKVTVVPAQTSAAEVLAKKPDGVFLSNGPGDPLPCDYAIAAIKIILDKGVPIFGICLGHQLLGLACGATSVKMKLGHHGANHPVATLETGRVAITSQNHGFAIDEDSLPDTLRPTHRSLFDGSLQGIHHNSLPAFGFQGHPEASPGPRDAESLFGYFVRLMQAQQDADQA